MEHVDPYSTDILEKARGGYTLLTEVVELTTLQFDDPEVRVIILKVSVCTNIYNHGYSLAPHYF